MATTPLDFSDLLTLAEAAALCRTTTDAIRARLHRRQLTPIKFGPRRTFISRDELLALLKAQGVR